MNKLKVKINILNSKNIPPKKQTFSTSYWKKLVEGIRINLNKEKEKY